MSHWDDRSTVTDIRWCPRYKALLSSQQDTHKQMNQLNSRMSLEWIGWRKFSFAVVTIYHYLRREDWNTDSSIVDNWHRCNPSNKRNGIHWCHRHRHRRSNMDWTSIRWCRLCTECPSIQDCRYISKCLASVPHTFRTRMDYYHMDWRWFHIEHLRERDTSFFSPLGQWVVTGETRSTCAAVCEISSVGHELAWNRIRCHARVTSARIHRYAAITALEIGVALAGEPVGRIHTGATVSARHWQCGADVVTLWARRAYDQRECTSVSLILKFDEPVKPGWQKHMYDELVLVQLKVLLATHGWDRHGLIRMAQVGPVKIVEQMHWKLVAVLTQIPLFKHGCEAQKFTGTSQNWPVKPRRTDGLSACWDHASLDYLVRRCR